jgi:cardiolipin synthase
MQRGKPMLETTGWTLLYFSTEWVIRIVMLFVVPFRRAPEPAKSWLLFLFFLPIPAVILYLLIGRTNLPRARRQMLARLPEALQPTIDRLQASPHIFHPQPGGVLAGIPKLARSLTRLDTLGGNGIEVVADYRAFFERLAADIDAARHHVHLLFYITAEDPWTEPIFQALERAVARGVLCRVLLDAYGSRKFSKPVLKRLGRARIPVHEALPVAFFRRKAARFDLRNHRKIAIIDGRIGWTGSQNLIAADFKPGIRYEELMVRLTGPIVLQLQYVFTSDWFLESGKVLDGEVYFPEPEIVGELSAQVLPSGPDFPGQGVHRLIVELIHQARQQVVITTPYFVPDESLLVALANAVRRGVEVSVVLSHKLDQLLVSLAQKSYYSQLLDAGVKIHLYRPAFLHAKHLTIDDTLALIGSSNMDIRSFVLNSEVSLICYSDEVVALLQREQKRYMQDSDVLTKEEWAKRSFGERFAQVMARMFSPLL